MKKFLCYYLDDKEMRKNYTFANNEKNARDKMRRKGIMCKAIVEVEDVDIDLDELRKKLQEHYSDTIADFICNSVESYVR